MFKGVPISRSAYARILASCARPTLAQDAKLDAKMLEPLFKDVNAKNFAARRKSIQKGLSSLLSGRLAQDQASPDDVALRLLDIIHGPGSVEPGEATGEEPEEPLVEPASEEPGEEEGSEDQFTDTGMTGEGSDVSAEEHERQGEREMLEPGGRDQEGETLTDKVCEYLATQGVHPETCAGVKSIMAGAAQDEEREMIKHQAAEDAEQIVEGQVIGSAHKTTAEQKSPAETGEFKSKGAEDEEEDDTAKDQPPKFPGKPMVGGGMVKDKKMARDEKLKDILKRRYEKWERKGRLVSKPAMDAAIQAAVKKARDDERNISRAIREAERIARPFVGDLSVAYDSADQVYAAALKALKIDVKGVHPSAYRTILELQQKPGAQQRPKVVAMDENASKSYAERFPGSTRLKVI